MDVERSWSWFGVLAGVLWLVLGARWLLTDVLLLMEAHYGIMEPELTLTFRLLMWARVLAFAVLAALWFMPWFLPLSWLFRGK